MGEGMIQHSIERLDAFDGATKLLIDELKLITNGAMATYAYPNNPMIDLIKSSIATYEERRRLIIERNK